MDISTVLMPENTNSVIDAPLVTSAVLLDDNFEQKQEIEENFVKIQKEINSKKLPDTPEYSGIILPPKRDLITSDEFQFNTKKIAKKSENYFTSSLARTHAKNQQHQQMQQRAHQEPNMYMQRQGMKQKVYSYAGQGQGYGPIPQGKMISYPIQKM